MKSEFEPISRRKFIISAAVTALAIAAGIQVGRNRADRNKTLPSDSPKPHNADTPNLNEEAIKAEERQSILRGLQEEARKQDELFIKKFLEMNPIMAEWIINQQRAGVSVNFGSKAHYDNYGDTIAFEAIPNGNLRLYQLPDESSQIMGEFERGHPSPPFNVIAIVDSKERTQYWGVIDLKTPDQTVFVKLGTYKGFKRVEDAASLGIRRNPPTG